MPPGRRSWGCSGRGELCRAIPAARAEPGPGAEGRETQGVPAPSQTGGSQAGVIPCTWMVGGLPHRGGGGGGCPAHGRLLSSPSSSSSSSSSPPRGLSLPPAPGSHLLASHYVERHVGAGSNGSHSTVRCVPCCAMLCQTTLGPAVPNYTTLCHCRGCGGHFINPTKSWEWAPAAQPSPIPWVPLGAPGCPAPAGRVLPWCWGCPSSGGSLGAVGTRHTLRGPGSEPQSPQPGCGPWGCGAGRDPRLRARRRSAGRGGALLLPGPDPGAAPLLRRSLQLPGPAVSTPLPTGGPGGRAPPHPDTPRSVCSGVFSDGRATYLIEPQAGAEHGQVSGGTAMGLPEYPGAALRVCLCPGDRHGDMETWLSSRPPHGRDTPLSPGPSATHRPAHPQLPPTG